MALAVELGAGSPDGDCTSARGDRSIPFPTVDTSSSFTCRCRTPCRALEIPSNATRLRLPLVPMILAPPLLPWAAVLEAVGIAADDESFTILVLPLNLLPLLVEATCRGIRAHVLLGVLLGHLEVQENKLVLPLGLPVARVAVPFSRTLDSARRSRCLSVHAISISTFPVWALAGMAGLAQADSSSSSSSSCSSSSSSESESESLPCLASRLHKQERAGTTHGGKVDLRHGCARTVKSRL